MSLAENFNEAKKWALGIRTPKEAHEGIERGAVAQQVLGTWVKRALKTAAAVTAVGLLLRSGPILLYGALPAWGIYGALKIADRLLEKSIRLKLEAAQEMTTEGDRQRGMTPAHEPSPKLSKKMSEGFNADASRPTAQAAASAKGFWSRFRLD
jgi:hypothetical protein